MTKGISVASDEMKDIPNLCFMFVYLHLSIYFQLFIVPLIYVKSPAE